MAEPAVVVDQRPAVAVHHFVAHIAEGTAADPLSEHAVDLAADQNTEPDLAADQNSEPDLAADQNTAPDLAADHNFESDLESDQNSERTVA